MAVAVVSLAVRAAVTIDVMVAYDQSAGGWLHANATDGSDLAARVVGLMNSALPATHLDEYFSFRLVGVMMSAANAEATGVTGRARYDAVCQSLADGTTGLATGAWKDVPLARDGFGADVVVMLVDSGEEASGTVSAGTSWSMGKTKMSDISKFAPWAYSVCGVQFAELGHVVTHEVGHVMGAGHSDLLVEDPGPQLHPYSSAYHFVDGEGVKRHTIMGYSHTSSSDFGYEPYPAFSSSEFTTPDGYPLGDALHDNTRTLRETCAVVSNFRRSIAGNGNEGSLPPTPAAKFTAKTTVVGNVVGADGASAGIVQLTVMKTDKNGQSRVSAVFFGIDGKKKVAKPAKVAVSLSNGVAVAGPAVLEVKGVPTPLVVTIGAGGILTGTFGAYAVKRAESIAVLSEAPRFRVVGMPDAIDGMGVLNDVEGGGKAYHLLPDGDGVGFSVAGKKWVFAKTAVVKYAKDRTSGQTILVVDVGKDGSKSNLCGLKLSVDARTGVFKGFFTVYLTSGTADNSKMKKMKFKVSGVVVDGAGRGRASCKGADVTVVL